MTGRHHRKTLADEVSKTLKLTRVTIPNGPVRLAGLVYTPDGEAQRLGVVLAHGYTASKASMDLLAAYLCGRGYSCLAFDFRGHKLGGSNGELNAASEAVEDLDAAAQWAGAHFGPVPCVLVGHSMGALVSLVLAGQRPEIAGVAAIATGPRPTRGFAGKVGQAMLAQRADYVTGLEPLRLLAQMDELAQGIGALDGRPALFVAARGDVLMKPEKVRELALRVGPTAEYVEVDGSHLEAPDRARGVVANWLDQIKIR